MIQTMYGGWFAMGRLNVRKMFGQVTLKPDSEASDGGWGDLSC